MQSVEALPARVPLRGGPAGRVLRTSRAARAPRAFRFGFPKAGPAGVKHGGPILVLSSARYGGVYVCHWIATAEMKTARRSPRLQENEPRRESVTMRHSASFVDRRRADDGEDDIRVPLITHHTRSHSVHVSLADQERRAANLTPAMQRSRSAAFGPDSPRRHRRTFSDPSRVVSAMAEELREPMSPAQRSPEKPKEAPAVSRSGVPVAVGRAQRACEHLRRQLVHLRSQPIALPSRAATTELIGSIPERCQSLLHSSLQAASWLCCAIATLVLVLVLVLIIWWNRAPAPTPRLQRVLLPATLLPGGINDFGASLPTPAHIWDDDDDDDPGAAGASGAAGAAGAAARRDGTSGVGGAPPARAPRTLRVCYVAAARWREPPDEPIEDSEGTLYGLVSTSISLHHNVTLVFLRPPTPPDVPPSSTQPEALAPADAAVARAVWPASVTLRRLHATAISPSRPTTQAAATSHRLLDWLDGAADDGMSSPRCDVAHFVDATAEALYPVIAQRQGLALSRTRLVLHVVAPLLWRLRRDSEMLATTEHAAAAHMERMAIQAAQPCRAATAHMCAAAGHGHSAPRALAAPQLLVYSGYLLVWLRAHGPHPRAHTAHLAPPPLALPPGARNFRTTCRIPEPSVRTNGKMRLVIGIDWRSPAEVAFIANTLTLLQRRWRDKRQGSTPPPWGRLHVHLTGRVASVGPRGGSGYPLAWPLSELSDEGAVGVSSFWGASGISSSQGAPGASSIAPGASSSQLFDGRATMRQLSLLHEWHVGMTLHPKGVRWIDLPTEEFGDASVLLLLPLLSSSAPLDLNLALSCRTPVLSLAVGGAPARLSATDGSRAAALVDVNATALAIRLDGLFRSDSTSPASAPAYSSLWARPAAAISDEGVRAWWRRWHAALAPPVSSTNSSSRHVVLGTAGDDNATLVNASSTRGGRNLCNGFRAAARAQPKRAPPQASLVVVVCARPASRPATLHLQASLARTLPAAETAVAALLPIATADQLLVLPESRGSCLRRHHRASAHDGDNATMEDGDGLLGGLNATLRQWTTVRLPLGRGVSCVEPARGSSVALGHVFGRIAKRVHTEYVLLLEAGTVVQPDALCALTAAAMSHMPSATADSHRPPAAAVDVSAERAFVPATRLWPSTTGVRASDVGPTLALPLGGPISVGTLRNTFGQVVLVRVATLKRLWRLETGGSGAPATHGAQRRTRGTSRGERCGELIWQLLARASLVGTAIEPVPFVLSDAVAPPTAADGGSAAAGETGCSQSYERHAADGRPMTLACVEVMALRPLLARRVDTAGWEEELAPHNGAPHNATALDLPVPLTQTSDAGQATWAPDVLDMTVVLAALQRLAGAS